MPDQAAEGVGIWPVPDGRGGWLWCVVGELAWPIGKPDSGFQLVVPDGFLTDLASIPKWLHWLLNPYDPATAPSAIVHDALLHQGFEQRVAVGEFYRKLTSDRFPRWKRVMYFAAVLLASSDW